MISVKPKTEGDPNELVVAVAGIGEVGYALWSILDTVYETIPLDPANGYEWPEKCKVDQLHIIFPYNELFLEEVVTWAASVEPFHIIIHSTIIPGTIEALDMVLKAHELDSLLSYSPCHCWSPHVKEHLLTMSKNLAGLTQSDAKAAAESLETAGMSISMFDDPKTLEWAEIQFIWRTALEQCWTNNLKDVSDIQELDFIQMGPAYTEIMNAGLSQMRNLSRFFPILSYNNIIPCDKHAAAAAVLALDVLPDGPFKEIITMVMKTFEAQV